MSYIKYSRSFIILEDKESQFRNTDQNVKGHVKIEFRNNRGTIRCIAQNLKYYEDARYLYKLYLFGKKDDNTIVANAGTLYIDRNGKGEQIFRFNALNVDGENNELFDFSIIAIVAQPNKDILDDDSLYPVLTGYMNKNVSESADRIINTPDPEAPQEVSQQVSQEEQVIKIASESISEPSEMEVNQDTPEVLENEPIDEVISDTNEELTLEEDQTKNDTKIEMDSEPKQAAAAWQTPPVDIGTKPSPDLNAVQQTPNVRAASNEPSNVKAAGNESSSVKASNNEAPSVKAASDESLNVKAESDESLSSNSIDTPKISRKPYDVHNYFTNYVRAVSTNLENVLPFYNQSEPFDVDKIGCQWWKIMNLMSIPFVNTSYLQSYPEYIRPYSMYNQNLKEASSSCHDLIYKYQHYIFGIEKDENNNTLYYYYGIPGRYMKDEQPDSGKSGFEYWQPLQGTKKRKGDYGYWIIAVNAKTGQLEIPFE